MTLLRLHICKIYFNRSDHVVNCLSLFPSKTVGCLLKRVFAKNLLLRMKDDKLHKYSQLNQTLSVRG